MRLNTITTPLLTAPTALATCTYPQGTGTGAVLMCQCYRRHYGVDRGRMINAINGACKNLTRLTWGPGIEGYPHYAVWPHYYAPEAGTSEEGVVLLKLSYTGHSVQNPSACQQKTINLNFDTCWKGFKVPMDDCDTGGENNKHGGFGNDPCLEEWTVDPNPSKNEPGIAMPSPWP